MPEVCETTTVSMSQPNLLLEYSHNTGTKSIKMDSYFSSSVDDCSINTILFKVLNFPNDNFQAPEIKLSPTNIMNI
jgi:hypothetical protein